MKTGVLLYPARSGDGTFRALRLRLDCSFADGDRSVVSLRRKRLRAVMDEADVQGAALTYKDLTLILLASKATIKRDIVHLLRSGVKLPKVAS